MQNEPYDLLSGNDALTLLEIIHSSLSCNSGNDFIALFPRMQRLFPFDFAHAMLCCNDEKKGIVPVHAQNINFPKEWLSEFVSRDYFKVDTVVKENFTKYRPQYWADTKKCFQENREVSSLCLDFGMGEGYSHGSPSIAPEKTGSMFSFSGSSIQYAKRTEAILELVIPHLHIALTKTCKNNEPEKSNILLSVREKEVLNWLKNGKSSWEMSVILGISQSTVNFHVYKIMQKLGVINRPQAVAVATHLGLIELG